MNKIPVNLSQITLVAVNAALNAGNVLKQGFGTEYQITQKMKKHDVVTEYDHAAEKLIIDFIRKHFPTHSFLAEERGLDEGAENILWVIDPLDGTINFSRNIPIFTISIAVYEKNEVISGVIYQPMTSELFVAEKNCGAYLNGSQLHVSKTKEIDHSIIATSLSFDFHKNPAASIGFFSKMAQIGNPMRALGSSTLNLAYVAAGRFDAYWSMGMLHPWDMGAGILLIEEAGGKVTKCNGQKCNPMVESTIVATNGHLHDELIGMLK